MHRLAIIAAVAVSTLHAAPVKAQETVRFANTPFVAAIGYASETRVPDQINVSVRLTGTGLQPNIALKELERRTREALDAVKAAGIPAEETESSGPDVEALYRRFYDEQGREVAEKRQPSGFRASYQLTIRTKAIDKIGPLLGQLTAASATLDGIFFSISNHDDISRRLEDDAVADAVARAKRQILAAGAKPGRILQIGTSIQSNVDDNLADLAKPNRRAAPGEQFKVIDFSFALRPAKQQVEVERRVVMEILPN